MSDGALSVVVVVVVVELCCVVASDDVAIGSLAVAVVGTNVVECVSVVVFAVCDVVVL